MDKKELWTNCIWEQNPTDEEQQEIYEALIRFSRIIEDLDFLNDVDYICNMLGNSRAVRNRYKQFTKKYDDFKELSEEFRIMRNMLFSENMDWGRLQCVLKC